MPKAERVIQHIYGLSIQVYGRFRLRQEFIEFADGRKFADGRQRLALSIAITVLPKDNPEGAEVVVSTMLRRKTDVATVMRYLRQWLLSEPRRILDSIEDRNQMRRQIALDVAEGTHVATDIYGEEAVTPQAVAELLANDIEPDNHEDFRLYLQACPAPDTQVFEIGEHKISMHRWLHAQVLAAYHELATAHPEVAVDPKEDLSVQDPELAQMLRERNRRENQSEHE